MFGGSSYEELNVMVENPRAEDYQTYFGDMEIPQEDKKKRISLAEKLEDNFLLVLILLFIMRQNNSIDWEKVRKKFEDGYTKAIREQISLDDYMKGHINSVSYDLIDSTKGHEGDFWYYSKDRARFISENESQLSFNHQEFVDAIESGKTLKQWMDVRDRKERKTHRAVGGKVIPINEPFLVGDSLMLYAKDSETFGADAKEIINCRCNTIYF